MNALNSYENEHNVISLNKKTFVEIIKHGRCSLFFDLSEFNKLDSSNIQMVSIEGKGIVGTLTVHKFIPVMYNTISTDNDIHSNRFEALNAIYYNWCLFKKIKPNHKDSDSRLKSKKFLNYLDSIGYGKDYVLIIEKLELF